MLSLTWLTILEDTNEPEVAVIGFVKKSDAHWELSIIVGVASILFCFAVLFRYTYLIHRKYGEKREPNYTCKGFQAANL